MVSDAIRDVQVETYRELEMVWQKTLANLRQAGVIALAQAMDQTPLLISAILFLSARWHERDMLDEMLGIDTPSYRDTIWALLFPALTEKGKEIYQTLIA